MVVGLRCSNASKQHFLGFRHACCGAPTHSSSQQVPLRPRLTVLRTVRSAPMACSGLRPGSGVAQRSVRRRSAVLFFKPRRKALPALTFSPYCAYTIRLPHIRLPHTRLPHIPTQTPSPLPFPP